MPSLAFYARNRINPQYVIFRIKIEYAQNSIKVLYAENRIKSTITYQGLHARKPALKLSVSHTLETASEQMGLDFDELGVRDVVDMLNQAKMGRVLEDFGNRNPKKDPVIHFYEDFLREYGGPLVRRAYRRHAQSDGLAHRTG